MNAHTALNSRPKYINRDTTAIRRALTQAMYTVQSQRLDLDHSPWAYVYSIDFAADGHATISSY